MARAKEALVEVTTETATENRSITIADEEESLLTFVASSGIPTYAATVTEPPASFAQCIWAKRVTLIGQAGKRSTYTGFLLQTKQDRELDALFAEQGVPMVTVQHLNKNQDTYWQFESLIGTVLCTSIPKGYSDESYRTGIVHVWNDHKGEMYGAHFECLLFLRGLFELGYTRPITFSLSRRIIEFFINDGLLPQFRVINAIKKARATQFGKNSPEAQANIAFYAYYIEFVKGDEVDLTSTVKGDSFVVNEPIAAIPEVITGEYVQAMQVPSTHLEVIESYLPTLPVWAEETAASLKQPPKERGTQVAQDAQSI